MQLTPPEEAWTPAGGQWVPPEPWTLGPDLTPTLGKGIARRRVGESEGTERPQGSDKHREHLFRWEHAGGRGEVKEAVSTRRVARVPSAAAKTRRGPQASAGFTEQSAGCGWDRQEVRAEVWWG